MKVNSEVASELESVCRARPTGNYLLYRCPDTDYYLINELIEFIPFIPNTK